jgi:diacylglycerol kinase family enzyme
LKERWGFAAYFYAALKEALAANPVRFHIVADDRELEISAVTVMIANVGSLFTAYLPLRLPLAPDPVSSWNDGVFDVMIIAPRAFPDWASVLWSAARQQFDGNDNLIHLRARRVSISADPPVPAQIDGDPAGFTPLTAEVIQHGARILLPG